MLVCEKGLAKEVITNPLTNNLLTIISYNLTDPKLLDALCFLAYQVLSHEYMEQDKEIVDDLW